MGKAKEEASTEQQEIHDAGDLRKYRIELPNLYDDADLDPYEFRLLAHYKRVGACYESTRTTAEKCKMSVGMVCKARDSLHEKGFIVIDEFVSKYDTLQITVKDVWAENFAKYAKMKSDRAERSQDEQGVHHMNGECSPHETKNELAFKEVRTDAPAEIPEFAHPVIKEIEQIIPFLGMDDRKEIVALAKDSNPTVFQTAFSAFHTKVYDGKYPASWRTLRSFWQRENATAKLRAKPPAGPPPNVAASSNRTILQD